MAIPKVIGIETEYGITGGDGDPINSSTRVVNAGSEIENSTLQWDLRTETPFADARERFSVVQNSGGYDSHYANTVLRNGARLYVDHAHPEYSSPECRTPRTAVLYDLAGQIIMQRSASAANHLSEISPIQLYKNNSDGHGNSYGTHENYLVSRAIDFTDIIRAITPHFVTRQVFTGAGKVASELRGRSSDVHYQLSQRADFMEELVGLETTFRRPIINTRDEPHAHADLYRRLHVIVGDANMSPIASLVKIGSTALLLAALEDFGPDAFPAMPSNPVGTIQMVSQDLSLREVFDLEDGNRASALDIQERLWELCERYFAETGGDAVAPPHEVKEILEYWRTLIDGLRSDVSSVSTFIDWVAKKSILDSLRDRRSLNWDDPRLKAIDLQYHAIDPTVGIAFKLNITRLFEDADIVDSANRPPRDTRAYFRGQCVRHYGSDIRSINWDAIVFEDADGAPRRVEMLDPLRGTEELTKGLFSPENSLDDLLRTLSD